ncbi:hypothetical protein HYPSUDRAFT_53717 [Hypholoma sublateritium FD-334 SS-4]|uniref:Uncharacterized protein n=1 Tax=Hypholoma sublateritium (strain FD-334 SS-4) TaxID=945553 RepID=A0A0D2MKQ6_HYPSF|nr:hypothetical protein HYPSUDRAFT_53717 [Hypholoma sublateritium FD-334 SS-4]
MESKPPRKSFFTTEERALIRPFQAVYLAAKTLAARKDIAITSILPSLITKWESELPDGENMDTEQASKNILQWIRNNWRLGDSPSKAKLLVKRTDIVWMLHRGKVWEEVATLMDMTEVNENTPGWFKYHMKAIGRVLANMTAEQLAAVDAKKADIAANGFLEEERPMWAAKFANRCLDAAAKAQYLEMGLISITMFGRPVPSSTGNHQMAYEFHENVAELLGVDMPSFKSLNRKALKDLKRDFSAYVKKVKAAAGLASDEMAADTVFLKYVEAGYPSIVGFKAGDVIPKKRLEELLRISTSTLLKGEGERSLPYQRIHDDQAKYIEAKYLPEGLKLIDPRNMKQADMLAFVKHIAEQQVTNESAQVFRFAKVATSRKTHGSDRHQAAKYPEDHSVDENMAEPIDEDVAEPVDHAVAELVKRRKKSSKATKAISKPAQEALKLQKEMEGMIDWQPLANAPVVPDTDNVAAHDSGLHGVPANTGHEAGKLVVRPQAGNNALPPNVGTPIPLYPDGHIPTVINHGGVPTFGPNDPMPYAWPMNAATLNPTMYAQFPYPLTPGPQSTENVAALDIPLYPAGILETEFGVIDPALIGLRVGPTLLPTPRPSITPQVGPMYLRSDTNSIPDAPAGRVLKPLPHPSKGAKGKGKEVDTLTPATNAPAKKKWPWPKGKAIKDLEAHGVNCAADDDTAADSATDWPQNPDTVPPPQSMRKTADVLATVEASKLILPAKRVRTAKVRTD